MQIHDRFGLVTLVRTAYDFEAKAPTSEVIAHAAHPDLVLQPAEGHTLTEEEEAEFVAYRAKQHRRQAIQRAHAARHFPTTLAQVQAWLAAAPREEAMEFRADTKNPLKRLARQIAELVDPDSEGAVRPGKSVGRISAKPPLDLGALAQEVAAVRGAEMGEREP